MANKSLFKSYVGKLLPKATARNREGAPAYAYDARHKLAQLAMTGTLSQTFYAQPHEQLGGRLGDGRRGRAALPGAGGDLRPPEGPHEGHAGAVAGGVVGA